jgi:transcriptional regulator with XRE-family HTH domain
MDTYGKRLLSAMKKKGLSQEQLSELLDVPRPSVSRIVNNKQFLDFDLAIKACEILEISLDWLAYGRETAKTPVYYSNPDRQRIEYLLTILQENDYKAVLVALEGIIEVRMKGNGGNLRSSGADGSVDASGSQIKAV